MDRRHFLRVTGSAAMLSSIGSLPGMAGASGFQTSKRLAVISLQGGMDGLAAVPPLGDRDLFNQRPDLIGEDLFELNREFGLTKAMPRFYEMIGQRQGAIVHASAFPYTKRSHFEGQNVIQSGVIAPFSEQTGWIGRALAKLGLSGRTLSVDKPLIMRGFADVDTVYPAHVHGANDLDAELIRGLLASDYGPLRESLQKIGESIQAGTLNISRDPTTLAFTAGQAMAREDGPVVSFVEVGGFDTHAQQGVNPRGAHQRALAELDAIVAAYRKGLADRWQETLVMTITEFGRTVKMNGSRGTDHGFASATLLAGGLVDSGAVIADWPSLGNAQLYERRDLRMTIDSRSIWCAALQRVFELDHDVIASEVFFDRSIPNIGRYLFA